MKAVYALYSTPELAQQAVESLHASGIRDPQITVLSSEPFEEYGFGNRDRKTYMPWIAGLGAATGMAIGYFLTSITQSVWPINTGGMPTVTTWTNLIIIFELTMLCAVFATVITLFVTAKIPVRLPDVYDPGVSEGKILIGVATASETIGAEVERALSAVGGETPKRIA